MNFRQYLFMICCMWLGYSPLSAQEDTLPLRRRHYSSARVFSIHHTYFVARFTMGIPTNRGYQGPQYRVDAGIWGGFEMGWMYQFHINPRWGIETGLRGEMQTSHLTMVVPARYSGFQHDLIDKRYGQVDYVGLILPLYACHFLPLHDRHDHWVASFKLGTDLKYGTGFYAATNGFSISLYRQVGGGLPPIEVTNLYYSSVTNGPRFSASFQAAVGISYILPNKRLLNLQIVGNWAPLYEDVIHYSFFPNDSRRQSGSFVKRYDYIGLELNYVLTNPYHNRKVRAKSQFR